MIPNRKLIVVIAAVVCAVLLGVDAASDLNPLPQSPASGESVTTAPTPAEFSADNDANGGAGHAHEHHAEAAAPEAHGNGGGHTDPFALILLEIALIVLVAMIGRWSAEKLNQPSVLGELIIGVIIGNIGYMLKIPLFVLVMHLTDAAELFTVVLDSGLAMREAAATVFSPLQLEPGQAGHRVVTILSGHGASQQAIMVFALWLFSNHGVILLLFMVGLETSVDEMLKVGPRALLVAIVGVVVPFLCGVGISMSMLPDAPTSADLFIGATLCATSVGITARVFKDLKRLQTPEAKIILGAAVIDDILGLIILALVVGIVVSGGLHFSEIIRLCVLSTLLLGGIIKFGEKFVRWNIPVASRLDRANFKLLFPLVLAFVTSWMANQIGLAAIVGAFAAGLILEESHFADHHDKRTVEEIVGPLEALFAPVFFVLMGMQVNLGTFLLPGTFGMAIAFTVVAIIGKIVCGLVAGKNVDRLSVGIGMVPRGEVGLIFASVGKGLGVVTDSVFSAIVIMVIVTTLITPVALKWSLFRTGIPKTPNKPDRPMPAF